jgi:uncharacterized membrane protein YbhN (UPF0104 family)
VTEVREVHLVRPAEMTHPGTPRASRTIWVWVKLLGGPGILAFLVWRLGTGGFLDGLRAIQPGMLLAAVGIGLLTTVCCAWRWCLVARGLGVPLALPGAVADYYRSLFLNAALPSGVLGDAHRAVRHGRDIGDVGLGARAVVLERSAGQAVLVPVGVMVLLVSPVPALSPAALVPTSPVVATVAVAGVLAVAVFAARPARRVACRWGAWRTAASSVRAGLLGRRIWPGVVVASLAALAGYLATFLIAARAAGSTAPTHQLLHLLVLALLAMAVPLSVGGFGPREGVCAWAFAAAGLGAAEGLAVAVVYGLSVFVASTPGAVVLVVRWWRRARRPRAASRLPR